MSLNSILLELIIKALQVGFEMRITVCRSFNTFKYSILPFLHQRLSITVMPHLHISLSTEGGLWWVLLFLDAPKFIGGLP